MKRTIRLLLAVKMKEGAMSQGKSVASRTWKRQENSCAEILQKFMQP